MRQEARQDDDDEEGVEDDVARRKPLEAPRQRPGGQGHGIGPHPGPVQQLLRQGQVFQVFAGTGHCRVAQDSQRLRRL